MKFSAAISLCLAPVALAKAVHNVFPVRRDPVRRESVKSSKSGSSVAVGAGVGAGLAIGAAASNALLSAADAALLAQAGFLLGAQQSVIVIWVNGGNNAATTTVNQVSTVTQTVTAGGGAAGTTAAVASTTVATGAGATHTVSVGGSKGLQFEPNSIQAAVGDMVVFSFLSQNHTATQSAFDTPCAALAGGMDSGFQANVNNSVNPPPQVAMQVMVATPLWFYCRQNGHCGKGMTFSINPSADKTQAMFQQLAIAQNGTGNPSAITGGTSGGGAASNGTNSAITTSALSSLTSTVAAGATATSSSAAAAGTGVVGGSGTLNPDGSCTCAVICAAGSFPAVQAQGIGAFGGMPGALPQAAIAAA